MENIKGEIIFDCEESRTSIPSDDLSNSLKHFIVSDAPVRRGPGIKLWPKRDLLIFEETEIPSLYKDCSLILAFLPAVSVPSCASIFEPYKGVSFLKWFLLFALKENDFILLLEHFLSITSRKVLRFDESLADS